MESDRYTDSKSLSVFLRKVPSCEKLRADCHVVKVNSEQLSRGGIVKDRSISGVHQQARTRMRRDLSARPILEVRWTVVAKQTKLTANSQYLFEQALIIASIFAFCAKPNGLMRRPSGYTWIHDKNIQFMKIAKPGLAHWRPTI